MQWLRTLIFWRECGPVNTHKIKLKLIACMVNSTIIILAHTNTLSNAFSFECVQSRGYDPKSQLVFEFYYNFDNRINEINWSLYQHRSHNLLFYFYSQLVVFDRQCNTVVLQFFNRKLTGRTSSSGIEFETYKISEWSFIYFCVLLS